LAGRIRELYGLRRDEAERQLRNWERSHFGDTGGGENP
jgi:hypothetical protein